MDRDPGMLHIPLQVGICSHEMKQPHDQLAAHCSSYHSIQVWCWQHDCWGVACTSLYSLLPGLAQGYKTRDSIGTEPTGQHHKLHPQLAALLPLFLIISEIAGDLHDQHMVLYSDNSPSVILIHYMAAKTSLAIMQLIRALSRCLQMTKASPVTTLHIAGGRNAMMDIPSH